MRTARGSGLLRRWAALGLSVWLSAVLVTGCGIGNHSPPAYMEVWVEAASTSQVPIEKDGPTSLFYQNQLGIGVYMPYIPWDGGTTYLQKLSTRIASGSMPDMFLPWNGLEYTLAKQGAIADLTDYLPKYAPNVWNRVPKEVWDIVRAADPTGQGRIYYIPKVTKYTGYGPFIRQDWLDNLGLEMPKTQQEYVKVLEAFRDLDANGNGDPNDEIPVIGRAEGRWMDQLFAMYGVAMTEGYPQWDLIDGQLAYSAVTPNMKAALAFIHQLYAEGLLDPDTFRNQSSDWFAKIGGDRVGSWFHMSEYAEQWPIAIAKTNGKVKVAAMPLPKVDGYDGFTTKTELNRPEYVIANKNEQTIIDCLKLLDYANDPKNIPNLYLGIEGEHYNVVNGKPVLLPPDPQKEYIGLVANVVGDIDTIQAINRTSLDSALPEEKFGYEQRDRLLADVEAGGDGREIAGDGIPSAIYDGYADIQNRTLYLEYMTKIVTGEWPIGKFDEFVDKWNKTGGAEVTKRAQEWYAKVSANK